jgi:RNA polymerase sigma-70 factor (family 1)
MALITIPDQSAILFKIAKGSERAFEELFDHYHNQLGEYVYMVTQSEVLAEEIVQDIFLKIWTNRSMLEEVRDFNSYLFILTRNYTLNALRKTCLEQKKHTQYLIEEMEGENDPVSFVDSVFTETDFQILLDRAIIQLPPQQQKVILLRMQGLKNSEIAVRMNLATDSVKKYHHWALKVLKNQLQSLLEVTIIVSLYFFE